MFSSIKPHPSKVNHSIEVNPSSQKVARVSATKIETILSESDLKHAGATQHVVKALEKKAEHLQGANSNYLETAYALIAEQEEVKKKRREAKGVDGAGAKDHSHSADRLEDVYLEHFAGHARWHLPFAVRV